MKKLLLIILWPVLNVAAIAQIPTKSVNVISIKSKSLQEAPRKVYIKNFKVFYQMIAEAEKTVYGGRQIGGASYTGNATARLAVGVDGLTSEDLQELTNKLYTDYIAGLASQGLEVLTSKDIGQIESFEEWELVQGPRVNQEQIDGSLMVIPADFSYYVKGVSKKGKEKTGGFMAGVTGDVGGFNSALYGPVPKVSDQLDDIIVAEVALSVPSIYLNPKSKLGTAKIKGGPYLRLGQARVSYVSGKLNKPGVASPEAAIEMILNEPIVINGVFEAEEFKTVATKSRTTVPPYAAFFTVENKTVELSNTIECDATVYQSKVGEVLDQFLDLTLDKLAIGLKGEKVK